MAIGAAVIGAVGAVGSAVSSRRASKEASKTQRRSTTASLEEQRRQFDLTREDFAGFRERGGLAGEEQAAFLGLRGVEAEEAALGRFRESPGQVFLRERQERSLLRNQAAIGGLGGGNVRTALQEQAFGIASQQLGERKDRLAQVAGLGAGVAQTGGLIGANISGGIAGTLERSGNIQTQLIREREATRQSGLRRVAGAFTGSGGILERLRRPPPDPILSAGGGRTI